MQRNERTVVCLPSMAELVFFRRGEEVLRFTLDAHKTILGRGERCDVVVPDPEVSRQQASLVLLDDVCQVEDLSGKGTLVAGQRLSRGVVTDGQDIALGQWRAVFRLRSSGGSEHATEIGQRTELVAGDTSKRGELKRGLQLRVRHNGEERIFPVEQPSFVIGKDPACDVLLDYRFISGKHLKVTVGEEAIHIVDQHSTNGTWLGGVRVFEANVPLLTSLRLGETDVTLEPAVKSSAAGDVTFEGMIGSDPAVRHLSELIERVAPSNATISIFGESGTGKELVARAIHNRSTRSHGVLIPVNCAAISKELIESELFGHEKGAFTGAAGVRKGAFEEADGGTLFLDEVGELPIDLQAKLLRALESGEIKRVGAARPILVDVRIVAATNRDLLQFAKEGKFREDLYYRLCVIPLHLPPLRNRGNDVEALAEHFLKMYAPRGQTVRLTSAALSRLKTHTWPGNIRELRNVVHRSMLLRKGPNIEVGDLIFDPTGAMGSSAKTEATSSARVDWSQLYQPGASFEAMVQNAERLILEEAMRRNGGVREKVSKDLQMGRSTLFKKLKDLGVEGE